jgi:hypothetical protein
MKLLDRCALSALSGVASIGLNRGTGGG